MNHPLALAACCVVWLAGCAHRPATPPAHEPVIGDGLKTAFAAEGLSVFADGCYQYAPVGSDTFIRQDSEALAAEILLQTVDRLHVHGVQERTHTQPLYCGMLVNSIINGAQHAERIGERAQRASPPYYSHPQIAQYPAALDAYLRLLRSVYGVVMQDPGSDHLPVVVDAFTLGIAYRVTAGADRTRQRAAEAHAAENGVTEDSSALLRSRLRARYVLMISDLERKTTGAARNKGVAVNLMTLGIACMFSTATANVCDDDRDSSYTAAALVDLKERRILWQNGGKTLDETLATLLD